MFGGPGVPLNARSAFSKGGPVKGGGKGK